MAAGPLIARGRIDYLVFDYLAEVTMSILAVQKAKNPEAGYATDFVDIVLRQYLPALKARGIRVVANAGGVNPTACARAIEKLAQELQIELKVGIVVGDDLMERVAEFKAAGLRDMFSQAPFPERPASVNAYLGAVPIARALDAGCDIVVTGRCVDSAVTAGVMLHAFAWAPTELDKLAQASLAGHLVECGAQCTGGLFTDWERVPDWANIGFPIIEASADGSFVITKPAGTGGLIEPATVAEQMLYEIGDPRAYELPDVCCDFTQVQFKAIAPGEDGEARVLVTGAIGRPPSDTYKVSVTFADGFRNTAFLTIVGFDAAAKARRTGQALFERMDAMLQAAGLAPLSAKRIEVLGAQTTYGAQANPEVAEHAREVVLKMAAKSSSKSTLELFAREFAAAGTSMAPGTTGLVGGRPSVTPVVRLLSFLVPKSTVPVSVQIGTETFVVASAGSRTNALTLPPAQAFSEVGADQLSAATLVSVPLIQLVWGRSGDKGNIANIGLIFRDTSSRDWVLAQVTEHSVAQWFAHNAPDPAGLKVERFDLPGCNAVNFVIHDVLGGGGMASLHTDNLAKTYAQVLMAMPVRVPSRLNEP
jgi:hypothetical protein